MDSKGKLFKAYLQKRSRIFFRAPMQLIDL